MKNKKIFGFLIASAAVLCTSAISMAQGAYLKVGGGYGIGTNRGPINSYFQRELLVENFQFTLVEQSMFNLENEKMEVIKQSFGQGGSFGIAGGYMFSKHIGAELGLSYFMSQDVKSKWDLGIDGTFTEEKKANVFLINPSLVISAGTEGVSPYARIGAIIGVAPKIASKLTIDDAQDIAVAEDKLTGGVTTGFSAALGITYPVSPKVSIFGELAYNGLSYKPTQREIVKITENGVNETITDVYDFAKQSIEDEVSADYADAAFDADKQLSHSYPLSNLGLNVGIQFNLGGSGLARNR